MNYLNPASIEILMSLFDGSPLAECFTCEDEGVFAEVECPTCGGSGERVADEHD